MVDTDANVVMSLDRSFAQETRHLRAFAVVDPADESVFLRLVASINMRDNVMLEGSAGVFGGDGDDTLSLLARRDFAYLRLKVFF